MLFSIIAANYNNESYLPELIKSIKQQTYGNWELIIVDDNSRNSPDNILKPFLEDSRIKYLKHNENLGVAATFKTATDNSKGEIIGMLGADDALTPAALQIMVDAHKKYPSASLINSDCYWCDEKLNVLEKYKHYRALKPNEQLIRNLTIGSFATFKKIAYDKTDGFDPFFKKAVDHDIYLKLDEVGDLKYVFEPLYLYRSNPIGISQNENGVKAAQFSIIAVCNAHRRRLGTRKENITKSEFQALQKKWFLRELFYQKKNKHTSIKLLKKALKEIPFIWLNLTFVKFFVKTFFFLK
jgi:glycosyltransferase involved in cell wall biosynthesis